MENSFIGQIESLSNFGWIVEKNEIGEVRLLNENFTKRYPKIPEDFNLFLNTFKTVVPNEWSTLLCIEDYNSPTYPDTFHWTFFENLSIESCDGNNLEANEITEFWDYQIPILISVKNGFAFISISVHEKSFGNIFYGFEPVFEDVEIKFNSFSQFIDSITEFTVTGDIPFPFEDFI
jgi:hypothetical protein